MAAVQDHVAKSVGCIGTGLNAGCPNGALSQTHKSRNVNRLKRSSAARFERPQGQVDFSCRNFSNNIASRVIQIWTYTAFSLVPTTVVI